MYIAPIRNAPGSVGFLQYNTSTYEVTYSNSISTSSNVAVANISAGGFYWSNGVPFVSSSYGNTQVAQYLPNYIGTIGNVTTVNQTIISNTNSSSSTSTGALVVSGGVGKIGRAHV